MKEAETSGKSPRPIRRLNANQKAEAIALWRAGSVTLDDLAKKFKKDRTTFIRLFKEAGVEKGEAAHETAQKVQEAVERNLVADASVIATRIRETKEEHYKMAAGLSKLTWSIIVEARNQKQPMGVIANDMKALKAAAEVLKITREERYAVLGISPDDEGDEKPLPELTIQELTAEDIKAMHQAQMEESDDLGLDDFEGDSLGDESLLDEHEDDSNDRVEVNG